MIFLRNVLRAKARSIMTALGIGVGVALFVAITAITLDLRQQIESAASGYNLEVVVFERRAPSPFSSSIPSAQMEELRARYGEALTPMVIGTVNEKWNSYALVMGVPPDFQRRIPLTAGLPPRTDAPEAMLGEIAAQKLALGPGDSLQFDGRALRISGIYRTGSRLFDGGTMVGIPDAQRILGRSGAEPHYTLGLLRAQKEGAIAAEIDIVNRDFPSLKAIPGTEFAGSLRLMRVVHAFVTTISVIAFVGTCLVVSNTLLMAISERTREIGILMAVGWTPTLVLRMLLAESVALCLVGAAAGNLMALGLLRLLNDLESVGFGWIPVRFPTSLAAASLAMALAVALLALAWPAFVVLRMQPLAALRHE